MFPHEFWSMNIKVQEDLPPTNNELEDWHTRFSTSFLHYHTHIWIFIEKLKQGSPFSHLKMAHGIAGAPNPSQRRIYREINERQRTLVDGYGQNNLIDFLRGISNKSSGARDKDLDMEYIWDFILFSGLGIPSDLKTVFYHLLNPWENFLLTIL